MTVQQRASIAEMMIRESEFVDRLPTLGDFIATAIAIHQFIETGAPWTGLPTDEREIIAALTPDQSGNYVPTEPKVKSKMINPRKAEP